LVVLLIAGAIVLGILLGLALGGSVGALARLRFLWWPLAFVGLALQVVPVPSTEGRLDHWLAVGLLIASYVVLLVFVALNRRLSGFSVIALGFALNVLVISVNGGMPVSNQALRHAYGPAYADTLEDLQRGGGTKHHLQRPDDVLMPLADVIPIGPPVRQVFSVGDLVAMAGIVWLLAAATKRAVPGAEGARRGWPADEGGRTGLPRQVPGSGAESAPARPSLTSHRSDPPVPD
jgi:hypothetical protein